MTMLSLGVVGSHFSQKYPHTVPIDVREHQRIKAPLNDAEHPISIATLVAHYCLNGRAMRELGPAKTAVADATGDATDILKKLIYK